MFTDVSTHSHPKVAAGRFRHTIYRADSFNTQPPEGGCLNNGDNRQSINCFNTQPPEGGCMPLCLCTSKCVLFQHTATRRWLQYNVRFRNRYTCFNTQPPEGGCKSRNIVRLWFDMFQHTATRRWLRT